MCRLTVDSGSAPVVQATATALRFAGAAFTALMRLYPDEDLGIVILANGTNLERQDIADAVANIAW